MDTNRTNKNEATKKNSAGKKRVSKRDRLAPAFRNARVRAKESRTADTGDPSVS
jgi:hypothetical protein